MPLRRETKEQTKKKDITEETRQERIDKVTLGVKRWWLYVIGKTQRLHVSELESTTIDTHGGVGSLEVDAPPKRATRKTAVSGKCPKRKQAVPEKYKLHYRNRQYE
jgi:hypothetical protein